MACLWAICDNKRTISDLQVDEFVKRATSVSKRTTVADDGTGFDIIWLKGER